MNFNFAEQISAKTNNELVEIYTNPSDYQSEFVDLARQEMINRNLRFDVIDNLKEKKAAIESETMALGKEGNPIYLGLIAVLAIFGGFLAIIGGYIYAYSTHVDDNGDNYFVYNETTRKRGRIILYTGLSVFILSLIIQMK